MPAVRAAEVPPGGLGHPPGAGRARRGRAPLVGQVHGDPGGGGLVPQGADEAADPPVPHPLVMPAVGIQVQDAARVPDRQGADLVVDGPGDDVFGGLVAGLPDPPGVPGLRRPLAAPVLPPPPRPPLTGPGSAGRGGPSPALAVTQVLAVFRADGPAGDQQPLPARPRHGVGVDDAQVHPGHPGPIRGLPGRVDRDGHLGGHVQVQPAGVEAEGHRPDLVPRVRDVPVQPDDQRRAAPGDRDPQPPPVQGERARIPADRDQAPPPARVAGGLVAVLAAPGRGEPGVAVAAQHRPRPGGIQFAERAGAAGGQFPAQLPVPGQRRVLPAAAPGGQFQDAAPHVARRPQQPEHPVPLAPGQPQPAPRGAVDHPRRISVTLSRHDVIMTRHTDKTANTTPKASDPASPPIHRTTSHRQRPSRSRPPYGTYKLLH